MFKKHNNPEIEEIIKSCKDRSHDLSTLKAIKIEDKRFCAWCGEGQLHHGNQKYCTQLCSMSAMAHFYPQKEEALHLLLHRQDFKCNICQFDYAPLLERIATEYHGGKSYNRLVDFRVEFNWFIYKRLKSKTPKSNKPEVDHILAISKGGQSLGLENHQILCYTCHKVKTKSDLSGKRKK